jgi:hypothetical protein
MPVPRRVTPPPPPPAPLACEAANKYTYAPPFRPLNS